MNSQQAQSLANNYFASASGPSFQDLYGPPITTIDAATFGIPAANPGTVASQVGKTISTLPRWLSLGALAVGAVMLYHAVK